MPALLRRIFDHAEAHPERLAYRDASGRSLSYGQLGAAIAATAHWLRQTLPPRATAILCDANSIAYPVAWLGALCAGSVLFPIFSESADEEIARAVQKSGANLIIGSQRARVAAHCESIATESLLDLPPSKMQIDDRGMLLLQSSGSTAEPKIVMRSIASLAAVAEAMVNAIGITAADRVLVTTPLSHSYGMEHGLLAPLWAGASVQLCPLLPQSALLSMLADPAVTILPGVPSTFEMLANASEAPAAKLRLAYSAGAPLPGAVFDAVMQKIGIRVTQLYGATEIGSVAYNPPDEPFESQSVGRAMKGVEIRILDPDEQNIGQVAVRAASMLDGYLGAEMSLADGFFLTGDLGRIDSTGRLFITGRLKLLIEIGGLKVNPLEVEAVLQQHPAVAQCAVIAVRQSNTVQRLKAVIVPRDPASPPTIESLRVLSRKHLASYKIPRVFETRQSLPTSATGKILRNQIEA